MKSAESMHWAHNVPENGYANLRFMDTQNKLRAYTAVSFNKGDGKITEDMKVVIYGRKGGSTIRAAVWFMGVLAVGSAGGCGYDKASAAFDDALRNMGLLDAPEACTIGGVEYLIPEVLKKFCGITSPFIAKV